MISEFVGLFFIVAIFSLALPLVAVHHGSATTRVVWRIINRVNGKETSYSKWGMDKEMYESPSLKEEILVYLGMTVFLGGCVWFSYEWFSNIEAWVDERYGLDAEIASDYLTFNVALWVIALMWSLIRLSSFDTKQRKLNALPKDFEDCYTVLEILSLYDSLRYAPPIYWETLAATPVKELTPELLAKYSGYAQPYQHKHFSNQNRLIVLVAIILGLPVIALTVLGLFVGSS